MKYLVVSDLHGSKSGLLRLEAAFSVHKPDVLINLGDTLFGSFDGDEGAVGRYFRSVTAPVMGVRGNCDYRSDAEVLGFDLPETRTFSFAGHTFRLQHRPWCAQLNKGDVALFGHTHVKCLYEEAGVIFLNPGSIGKPRDDGPGYALIDETGIALYDADTFAPIKKISF